MKRIEDIYPSWAVFNDKNTAIWPVFEYLEKFYDAKIDFGCKQNYIGISTDKAPYISINSTHFGKILTIDEFISLTKDDKEIDEPVNGFVKVTDYTIKKFGNIKRLEGEIKSISEYGGSLIITFKNGKKYKLSFDLYQPLEVTLD